MFANGGFATHNHTIVIGREPITAASFPQNFHFQYAADTGRGAIPAIVEHYEGPATIETRTVLYERDGSPKWGGDRRQNPCG